MSNITHILIDHALELDIGMHADVIGGLDLLTNFSIFLLQLQKKSKGFVLDGRLIKFDSISSPISLRIIYKSWVKHFCTWVRASETHLAITFKILCVESWITLGNVKCKLYT